MKTPDTIEGFLTECIMGRIMTKLGQIPDHVYNPIYSAVLEVLNERLGEIRADRGMTRKEYIMKGFC